MKRVFYAAGLLISLACAYFFARAVADHWSQLSKISWSHPVLLSVGSGLALYLGTFPVVSFAWRFSLKAFDCTLSYGATIRILLVSQFAKYLPGNVGHHVGRVVLAKRLGLPTDRILGSMFLDTGIVLAASAICSLPAATLIVFVTGHQAADQLRTVVLSASCIAGLALILTTLPPVHRFLARQAGKLKGAFRWQKLLLLAGAWCVHCLSFLAGGTALYLLCIAFGGTNISYPWLQVVGIYGAAWFLGFVIPGAPAGLGVREVALMLGLSPLYGAEAATAAAAALRLVTTVGDGLAFLAGMLMPRRWVTHARAA